MDKKNDSVIVEELLKGNEMPFRDFYTDEREKFLNWCQGEWQLNEEQAADYYQEAQLFLYENILSGKLNVLTSKLATYLYAIGKNQIRIRLRKETTMLKHEEALCEHMIFLKGIDSISDEEKINKAKKVASGIEQMLEPCKSLLTFFYYQNMSFKQIAERMNYKNASVAKNQKKRCLERLREKTKNDY